MQNWNLKTDHPVTLTLASDARICPIDIINDQIWQLKLNNPEAPFISLETTFGLRARLCRIFPTFSYQSVVVSNPTEFSGQVVIHQYYPNYIEISCKPFPHINARIEYWVPDSHGIAGRITFSNSSHEDCTIQVEWASHLLPLTDGYRMTNNEIDLSTILAGKTSNLEPVLFLTGGAQSGKNPFPSLNIPLLVPGNGAKFTQWAHVALNDRASSFAKAKEICSQNWDAEFARITRINSKSIEIKTENKGWDTVFALSQVIAYQLYLRSDRKEDEHSFTTMREPDQGYSMIGDGSDYENLRYGISAFESFYLMNYVIPFDPELLRKLFESFLNSQEPSGEIDMILRFGGQKSHLLAMPVFASLLNRLYEISGDLQYITAYLPKVVCHFKSWFSIAHDRDTDQTPEWDHPSQTSFEDRPSFSKNNALFSGIDISSVECPDLISLLFKECQTLIKLAKMVNDGESAEVMTQISLILKDMVETTWNDKTASYHYRDRDTHLTSQGEFLASHFGDGVIPIQAVSELPIRPMIIVELMDEIIPPFMIYIHGTIASGVHRVENIQSSQVRWQNRVGVITSEYSYLSIERIEVSGLRGQDSIRVQSVDLSSLDLSLALPIWAGIPTNERAKVLINLSLMNKKKYLSPYGLRTYPHDQVIDAIASELSGIDIPGNTMIIDGLLNYGEYHKAAEIFQRLMKLFVQSLQQGMTLHQAYHSETGKPHGAQNSVTSLVPIGLFLKILGIQIIDQFKVMVTGNNPFPWPVTIKYQGLTIIKHENKSIVIFPDGHNVTVTNDQRQIISREPAIN